MLVNEIKANTFLPGNVGEVLLGENSEANHNEVLNVQLGNVGCFITKVKHDV